MTIHPISNPLLHAWTGSYGLPPFEQIESSHFEPAFAAALVEHRAELALIAAQADAPALPTPWRPLTAAAAC
ncbi:hypothetical protein ACVBEH_16815 [Roseateles sp. GG27B]